VLSQDVCRKNAVRTYGGPRCAWILEQFLPRLRADGIPESAIDAFPVRNPARLTVAPPPA
jgi:predicted metal-dependent phosphotriesterase family hydrolase